MISMNSLTKSALERYMFCECRWLRYLLCLVAFYHTLLDVIKTDAYNSALLDHFLPPTNRTVHDISSILVINDVLLAALQMLVIVALERLVLPSVWCVINLAVTAASWSYFSLPRPDGVSLAILFLLRSLNVRYSMLVNCFGTKYCKYTIAVQFFVSVLPHLVRLPLLRYVPDVVFQRQSAMLAPALFLTVWLIAAMFWVYPVDSQQSDTAATPGLRLRERDHATSWLCNAACSLFLAGVYYDFPMFSTYANRTLGYDFTYDMVYVHVCLFSIVFVVNVGYNGAKHAYRRYLDLVEMHDHERRLATFRYYCVCISYAACFMSRLLFLTLQLRDIASLPWFVTCLCLAGLGGNVQPLLAELMFRQRSSCSRLERRDFAAISLGAMLYRHDGASQQRQRCENGVSRADQLFKWLYVSGQSLVTIGLLAVWLLVAPSVGSWWFTANAIVMIAISAILFGVYFRLTGRFLL